MLDMTCAWASPDRFGEATSIYLGSAYQALCASNDHSESRLVECRSGADASYLPLLVRNLGHGVREGYSAYGYGGFWGSLALDSTALARLKGFLSGEGIVGVFLRHAPFLENSKLLPEHASEINRRTYVVPLRAGLAFEDYVASLDQKLRWSVKTALRSAPQLAFTPMAECSLDAVADFHQLYDAVMQEKQASDYFHFRLAFLQAHGEYLGPRCELAELRDPASGELLAGAMFVLDWNGWVHYHLSAASDRAKKLQFMELLMAAAIHRYGNAGYGFLHLGGGHSLDETDGLSRFKRKFSGRKLDFRCSKIMCDEDGYGQARAAMPLQHPNLFLIADARGGA